jgi:CheY-like chemotaxis protein
LKDVPIVLVVEDEEPLQEIVHDALKEGGFDVTTVASGQEAVAMIESGVVKYSALVTDVNLKGPMKGWEIARLVREIDPAFPVVYMTGAAADDWASHQAVRSSAIGHGDIATAQYRLADFTVTSISANGCWHEPDQLAGPMIVR